MHIYLRQAIAFLKSNEETPVNWHALMWDVLAFGNPQSTPEVQKRWAQGFWRYQRTEEAANEPVN